MAIQIPDEPSKPLYRRIADAYSAAIRGGQMQAGERLPAQTDLAEQLAVSRITVNQAYAQLERMGMVVSRRGSGTYVCEDALAQQERTANRRFDSIVVVTEDGEPVQCHRSARYISMEILAGLVDVLGSHAGPFTYVDSFDAHCLEAAAGGAVVSLKPRMVDATVFDHLKRQNVPVIDVWHNLLELPVPRVVHDAYQGPRLACQHLVDCGYGRIGYIGSMGSGGPLGTKFFEFTNVLFQAGLDFQVRHVREVRDSPGLAYQAAKDIVADDVPDAFFVDTDWRALEVLAALHHAGFRVPKDVGLVGFDDIPEAATAEPALTTVRVPRREVGRAAARTLLDWQGYDAQPETVTLDSKLIVRESTAHAGDYVPDATTHPTAPSAT